MKRALYLILALSGLLAAAYAWVTPLGQAPDEGAHLHYVRVVATERRLPALDLRQRRDSYDDPNYEAHQSPLYYAAAAPFYLAGRALGGEPAAGQACRLLSILLGLAATALIWRVAREIAPERPALALAAAGLAAFLPMRLAVMGSVSNDMAAEATASLALLLMLRAVGGAWDARRALALGAAIGVALLAKQSAVLLLPTALLAIYLAARAAAARVAAWEGAGAAGGREEERARVRCFLVTGAVVAAAILGIAGWWFARNHLLYGDPLGQRAFNWYFEDTPRWANFRDMGRSYGWYWGQLVLPTAFATFWGAFGHLDRPELFMGVIGGGYPPQSWLYPILALAVLAAVAGGVRYYLRNRERLAAGGGGARTGVAALHAIFVTAAFLNFNATYFQAQGRYLFPALAVLAVALAGGWLEWGRKREVPLAWGIVASVLILAGYAFFGVLLPVFGPPLASIIGPPAAG